MKAPELSSIAVPPPGTSTVFSWPEVIYLDITARLSGSDIVISWPPELTDWPSFDRDLGQGLQPYFGNSGLIYLNTSGVWVADATEWMRPGREDRGTRYPYEEKWRYGPHDGGPIGLFVAGQWRHTPDDPKHHRRTAVKWFSWPDLEPYDWDDAPPPPGDYEKCWNESITAQQAALEALRK